MKTMIPFSPPYINDNIIKEVVDSLQSGWITTGPKVKMLEQEVGRYIGNPNVLCVNSWTSGAIMILKWLGLKDGDEVIIPAYTYSATALAVIHAGGKPVMADVGEDFNININTILGKINSRTKAIMPVDFAGYPCDYDQIIRAINSPNILKMFTPSSEIQKRLNRILVISDAAHSLGAVYKGKRFGSSADITIFSFHAVKNITTGEGGAIVINMPDPFKNDALYQELRLMTLNCQTKDAFTKSKAGGWKYDIVGLGMKINMADINAAIGVAQMREYENLLELREKIFRRYTANLQDYSWTRLPNIGSVQTKPSFHIFPLRIKDCTENQRDSIIDELTQLGVSVNVHFIPLPKLTFFRDLGNNISDFPVSMSNYVSEISLPIYPQLKLDQVDYITESIVKSYIKVFNK